MGNTDTLRKRVREFFQQNPNGSTEADAFAAWYLHRRFKLSPLEAAGRAPGGNHDYGLDGYFLDEEGASPTLYLIQAKFTESLPHIKKGFAGFAKLLPPLANFLKGEEFPVPSLAYVVQRLSSDIARIRSTEPDLVGRLRFEFIVIHLSDAESEGIESFAKPAISSLGDAIQEYFPYVAADAHHENPWRLAEGIILKPPVGPEESIRFHGDSIPSAEGVVHLAGFGYLSDLVGLYEKYRDALFSRNVRYFLMDKVQKGPAGYMRDTLRSICIPSKKGDFAAGPDSFALFHNGVTLTATKATQDAESTSVTLVEPNVLNGCQTIKNAYLMLRAEGASSKLLDIDRWNQVVVPLRVVVTKNEALVRQITVGLNRQNAIRPAAFRANEPEQVRLSQRFADLGIFYERQEKAFKNLRSSDPALLSRAYPNSQQVPLGMEELAQVIASSADKPALSGISKIADLFEDQLYRQIFSDARLEDLPRLIFLRNVFACAKLVANDLQKKSSALRPLQPGKFRFVIARALSRYAWKKQVPEIEEYSGTIEPKFGPQHPLRLKMGVWCGHQHTGLQQYIPTLWATSDDGQWISPTDAEACRKLLKKAGVESVDVFEN